MKEVSYTELLRQVQEARAWIDRLNTIQTNGSRLERLEEELRYLVEVKGRETTPLANSEYSRYWHAISDASAFGEIFQALKGLKSADVPRRTIKHAIIDIGHRSEEDSASSNTVALDSLAELQLAAHLSSRGMEIIGFDDVRFRFEGRDYRVEVKRPSTPRAVAARFVKAKEQIRKKLQPGELAIISFQVDRLYDLSNHAFEISDKDDLSRQVQERACKFWKDHKADLQPILDPRIVAITVQVPVLVRPRPQRIPSTGFFVVLACIVPEGTLQETERLAVDRLGQVLRSSTPP